MPTIPTGEMERELKKLYLRFISGLSFDSSNLQDRTASFQRRSIELIERMGGYTASLGALGDFPTPKLLDLSPWAGTFYVEAQQAAIRASIMVGLNSREAARAMFKAGMDQSYRRLERLARTETTSAYWKNAFDSVADLPALVMLWGSEDGPRTCAWCRERDGLVMDSPNLRDHPNGRCTPIPTLRSRVQYRGSISPDNRIYYDDRWNKATQKPQTPAEVWVEQYKAAHPNLSDANLRNLDAIARGDQYGAKRMLNDVSGQKLTQAEANQAIKAIKGQTPQVIKGQTPKAIKVAPKPVTPPQPTEPMSRIFKGVTKVQEDELARYTQNSFQMNAALRSGVIPEQVAALDAALQASSLPRATKVLRAVDGDAGDAALRVARSGGTYTDEAFMSTQKKGFWDADELIENFAMSGDKPVLFEFDLPAGYHALDIGGKLDDHPLALGFNQGEVLLPRNARFIPSKPVDKGDYWLIRMRPAK